MITLTVSDNTNTSITIDTTPAYDRPSARNRVRELLELTSGDYDTARRLILHSMRQKYPGFHSHRHPGKREYDALKRALHDLTH